MAIENSVSNNFLSTFIDSINVFDCHLIIQSDNAIWGSIGMDHGISE